jgi:hypothetical protein
MRLSPLSLICVIAVGLLTTACATAGGGQSTMLSPTLTVVAGVAMLEPTQASAVTYDAVKLEPENAALIAVFAVSAAPDRAQMIITAARNGAPDRAADIDAAIQRALRARSSRVWKNIPDHAYLVKLVDFATIDR